MKQLLLSDREAVALDKALDLYIRLGLGQLSAVGDAVKDLTEKRDVGQDEVKSALFNAEIQMKRHEADEWKLEDPETSSLTVAAFGIQAKLGDNTGAWEWACKTLHANGDMD